MSINKKKYIQEKDVYTENELHISSILKKINNYNRMFAISLSTDDLSYKELITDDEISKITQITTTPQKTKLLLITKENIVGKTMYEFISEVKDVKYIIYTIIISYKHLLCSINELNKLGIVNFNININNIIIDSIKRLPIIVDFRLSLDVNRIMTAFQGEKTNYSLLKTIFIGFNPEFLIWPIEVHYISYILYINRDPTYSDIQSLCDKYVEGNVLLKVYSKNIVLNYRKDCIDSLNNYNKLKWTDKIKQIIEDTYETWDNYGLSILMINVLYMLGFNENNNKKFFIDFSKMLLKNIDPNYKNRLKYKETIEEFNKLIYVKGLIKNICGK